MSPDALIHQLFEALEISAGADLAGHVARVMGDPLSQRIVETGDDYIGRLRRHSSEIKAALTLATERADLADDENVARIARERLQRRHDSIRAVIDGRTRSRRSA